ncbi:MAG: hypothetical protein P8X96_21950 [Desulfobacteraceae bacterium]
MATKTDTSRRARLDAETGTIRKRWQGRMRVVLVYPNHYHLAMANLGFQTVYQQLNAMDHVVCERAFLPEPEEGDSPVVSLESGRRFVDFDCVAFSLSFENDYPHVLTLLQKAALPQRTALRGDSLPLIIAGGVAVFLNPEPLAPFIDCFLLGEAEALLSAFFQAYDPAKDRKAQLVKLAQAVEGVYVPAFYRDTYGADGTLQGFHPTEDVPDKVRRLYTNDLDAHATQSTVVTPQTGFEDAYLIEVSRGCPG